MKNLRPDLKVFVLSQMTLTNWTNPNVCGENGIKMNGKDLIYASCSLRTFTQYMNSIYDTLPFKYDVATALFELVDKHD